MARQPGGLLPAHAIKKRNTTDGIGVRVSGRRGEPEEIAGDRLKRLRE
jgi:hypothetical protein